MGFDRLGRRHAMMTCALALQTVFGAASAPAQDRALPPDAVAVLDHFLGEWETRATLRRPGERAREVHTRGQGTCARTLEGRYYEFRTHTVPRGDAELQIMTYDEAHGVYRQWVFSSDGYTHQAEGTWDSATSTLRWSGEADGTSFVILDHFVSPERLDWTLRRTRADGQAIQTIEGQLTRTEAD